MYDVSIDGVTVSTQREGDAWVATGDGLPGGIGESPGEALGLMFNRLMARPTSGVFPTYVQGQKRRVRRYVAKCADCRWTSIPHVRQEDADNAFNRHVHTQLPVKADASRSLTPAVAADSGGSIPAEIVHHLPSYINGQSGAVRIGNEVWLIARAG